MNASLTDQPRTSPVAFRTKSDRSSYGLSPAVVVAMQFLLSAREQEALDFLLAVEVDDGPEEITLLVGAPGIDAERPADPGGRLALVDVAVEGQRRLEIFDGLADGGRADGFRRATRIPQVHLFGQLRGFVQARVVGRAVEAEDRPLGLRGDLPDDSLDPLRQLRLVFLAVGIPRREIRPPGRRHLEPVELDDAALRQL